MNTDRDSEEAVLEHLQEIAHVKRAMLQAALAISNDYPGQASTLLRAISALTRSADRLLGDTVTMTPPTQ